MFFKERTTDWLEPKISAALGVVLVVTVLGIFYLGIFGDSAIKSFTKPAENVQLK